MSRRAADVPNAWDDDDWVSQADKGPPSSSSSAAAANPPPVLNRQERLQQHAEANRKLWESADSPDTFHFIEATSGGAPLAAAPFRPQVKVLSRKPAPSPSDPSDPDSDRRGPGAANQALTPDEIRAKQRRERDEKQRRYDEARAKIFGESAPSSRGSSPGAGAVTPPRSDARGGGPSSMSSARGRGRGNGNGYRANSSNNIHNIHNNNNNSNNSSSSSNTSNYPSANTHSSGGGGGGGGGGNYYNNGGKDAPGAHYFENRRPANPAGPTRELYDPNSSSPKPDLRQSRGFASGDNSPRVQTPRTDQQQQPPPQQQFPQYQQPFPQYQQQQQFPQYQQQQQQQFPQYQQQQQFPQYQQQQYQHQAIRSPRGPDSSGRGGFGQARRGAREN